MDYEAIAKQFGATNSAPAGTNVDYSALAQKFGGTSNLSPDNVIKSLAIKKGISYDTPVPGADTAFSTAKPSDGSARLTDIAKIVPNALGDVWNLVKEIGLGVTKKPFYDIPKAAIGLATDNNTPVRPTQEARDNYLNKTGIDVYKDTDETDTRKIPNIIRSIVPSALDVGSSLIPQSAKEIFNTRAISEIPAQFQGLVKDNGGSYAKALLAAIKAVPEGLPDAALQYANQIDRARQAVENHPVNEFLGYMGLRSMMGGAPTPEEGVKPPVAPSAPKSSILSPFAGSYKPEVAQMFDSEGIKAPLSAISDSNVIKGGEAIASKGLFGAGVADITHKAVTDLEKKTNDVISAVKPEKIISDENLGKTLQQGLKDYEEKFKVTEEKIYKEFSKTYGESNVYGMKTKEALGTLLDEQGKDYFGGIDNRLKTMFNKLTGSNDPELKGLNNTLKEAVDANAKPADIASIKNQITARQAALDKELTFNELKSTRSSVGEAMQKEPQNTALKRLYGALSEDMKTSVENVVKNDPFVDNSAKVAKENLDMLNKGYQTGKAKIESNVAMSIDKSNPESIAQNLIKRNSADTLKIVKEIVGPDRFSQVSKAFMRNLFESSVTRDKFDVSKLKEKLGAYDKDTLNEIMDPAQRAELKDAVTKLEKYQTMGEALKSGQKMASGSQTAFLSKIIGLPNALFSGNFTLAGAILFGDLALKTLFTSDLGRKILTEGVTPPNLKALQSLKNISEADKQLIIQSARAQTNKK